MSHILKFIISIMERENKMKTVELISIIKSDLYRIFGYNNKKIFIKSMIFKSWNVGAHYLIYLRLCNYLYINPDTLFAHLVCYFNHTVSYHIFFI